MSWLWARFDHEEKFTYYEALVVALEKNCRIFALFPDFISIFTHFPGLENWFTNFKTFSGIQDFKRNQLQNHSLKVPLQVFFNWRKYLYTCGEVLVHVDKFVQGRQAMI